MKSDSGSERPHKWRLSRTLRRNTAFRPIEAEDVKYLWAAYKKGALDGIGIEPDLPPDKFKEAFTALVLNNCHAGWTLFANTKKGFIPAGVVLGTWGPGQSHLVIMAVAWMPWTTKRNIVESCVGFFNGLRGQISFMGYALPEHKRMYEVCAMHGIARRVGTSYVVIPGHAVAVFESRTK